VTCPEIVQTDAAVSVIPAQHIAIVERFLEKPYLTRCRRRRLSFNDGVVKMNLQVNRDINANNISLLFVYKWQYLSAFRCTYPLLRFQKRLFHRTRMLCTTFLSPRSPLSLQITTSYLSSSAYLHAPTQLPHQAMRSVIVPQTASWCACYSTLRIHQDAHRFGEKVLS